jgi:hypothetical protein
MGLRPICSVKSWGFTAVLPPEIPKPANNGSSLRKNMGELLVQDFLKKIAF